MFVVDTNLLVYYAAPKFPEHAKSRTLVEGWRRDPSAWYTTWGILYEFLRVITHPSVLEKPWTVPEAWGFIEALLASPGLSLLVETDRHASIATRTIKEVARLEGNIIHDAHTAILMREHGVRRIYTRDTDFHRFPFLEVIDPLAGPPRPLASRRRSGRGGRRLTSPSARRSTAPARGSRPGGAARARSPAPR